MTVLLYVLSYHPAVYLHHPAVQPAGPLVLCVPLHQQHAVPLLVCFHLTVLHPRALCVCVCVGRGGWVHADGLKVVSCGVGVCSGVCSGVCVCSGVGVCSGVAVCSGVVGLYHGSAFESAVLAN